MKTFGSNKSQIYYDLFQSLSHGTNAKVQGDQAERLTATTSIVEWHTSSRWSPLKMTATKVRMAHQAVPVDKGGRSRGKPFVAVAVLGTQGAGQRGNPLWLSPCPRDPDVLDLGVEITIGVAWRDMLSEGQSCTLGPHIMPVRIDFGRTK